MQTRIATSRWVERYETIVIGGGQAGLAAGYHLAKRDADFLILDAAERVGDSWRNRWDSLRLFTPAKYSALPGMRFPAPNMHLPDKDEVADYLERYVHRFGLPVRSMTQVTGLTQRDGRCVIHAGDTMFEADNVIVATGPFQRPRVPALASQLDRSILQLHSSEYRSPLGLPAGKVLVAGVGNSGAQIALELSRVRKVWLAGTESGALPRTVLGLDLYRWLWPAFTWFSTDTRVGRRMRARTGSTDPLIGIDPRSLTTSGIDRVGRVGSVCEGLPVSDGRALEASVVIWCTGFRPDYSWIDLPVLGTDGYPLHQRGVATAVKGLYFVGLRFQHRRTSALIGGVGLDAEYVVEALSTL